MRSSVWPPAERLQKAAPPERACLTPRFPPAALVAPPPEPFAGTTRAMRQAVKDSYKPRAPVPEAVLVKANKDAHVRVVPDHGLVVVQYASGRPNDKQEHALTPRGKKRTPMGGFYSS